MPDPHEVRLIEPDERVPGALTPGMTREEAVATQGLWAGFVRMDPGMRSGWHHHADYESVIYMLTGAARFEFGPGGSRAVEARPGDFVYVPPRVVHREVNTAEDEGTAIVVRAGSGPKVVNVDGPDPA
jgi:uncharacterized RmlC-like cupin family protein